jgi:predicted ribosome quality control (RQC) complex YloA/Tae2 family protein
MREFTVDGIPVRMGRNQKENDYLLKTMEPNHTWFHISEFPSAHLAIPVDYKKIKKNTLYRIALEVKKASKYRKQHVLPVVYTYRKNLELTDIPANPIIKGKIQIVNT